jgi:excinuclease ABC subunit C
MNETLPPDTPLTGAAYIKAFAARLSMRSGVYRMIGQDGEVLYVGKAKHLKNRVVCYTNRNALTNRILRMVEATRSMEVIETRSEAEALLLEANLIKKHKPRYNILLKDDKSYPYIRLSDHSFPRIVKHRGAQKKGETYFGPFASAGAVAQSIGILQRAFLLRPCPDTVFRNRTRPCLQYQIKRCSAPCVGYVSEEDYATLIRQASDFLHGKNREVQDALIAEMNAHAEAMDYEKAATFRDRIRVLTQIQQQQGISQAGVTDTDVIACHSDSGQACLQVWFFRGGQHYGNHAYFPSNVQDNDMPDIMAAFMGQYYQSHPIPKLLLLESAPSDMEALEEALTLHAGHKVSLVIPKRGERKALVDQLKKQAQNALGLRIAEQRSERAHLKAVGELFGLPAPPTRIEAYDNSHIAGTHAVGAMIMTGESGFDNSGYRRFTMRNTELVAGDDYAMMREMLTRRLSRLQKEDPERVRGDWPSLLLIDGGKGHLGIVREVMEKLGIRDLPYVCIAKGVDRNAGREQFFMEGREPFQLPINDPTLHYLQRVRDEVHRFAITSHRIKRANAIRASTLDDIPNIGAARKKALMLHFGTAKAVETATLKELENTPSISAKVAKQVYEYFNG